MALQSSQTWTVSPAGPPTYASTLARVAESRVETFLHEGQIQVV